MRLDIIRWIQQFSCPGLDILFTVVTLLGEQLFLVGVVSFVYWNIDKNFGKYMCFSVGVSLLANNLIKDIFKRPRPIGEEGIVSSRVETATGYSFPSGHSQSVAVTLFSLSVWLRRIGYFIAAFIFTLLVAVSRLYLGVHYPEDVIFGALFGFLSAVCSFLLFKQVRNKNILFGGLAAAALLGIFIARSPDYIKSAGLILGFFFGNFAEEKWVRFEMPKTAGRKIARWLMGIALTGLVMLILKKLLPANPFCCILRYSAVGFTAVALCPMLFKKLKI